METEINVLSLFDGMSCGQIALKKLGVKVNKYYASEIDKPAITNTQHNFNDTIQLGSVTGVEVNQLDRIDLLIGGSPCQSFSFAGKRKGMATKCEIEITRLEQYLELKQQGFEFEGQSYLFWEYIRILTDIRKYNPDVLFLLENVEMAAKWERVLSGAIGVFGVHINSALVSAQNRKRIYWTNIKTKPVGLFGELHSDIQQPTDRGIFIKDILQPENEVNEKYYLSTDKICWLEKQQQKAIDNKNGFRLKSNKDEKSLALTSSGVKQNLSTQYVCVSMVGRRVDKNGTRKDNDKSIPAIQRLEPNTDRKTGCLTSVQKDNLTLCLKLGRSEKFQKSKLSDKSFTVDTQGKDGIYINKILRRLTPTECARLQTIPDWYKWVVSETQIYRMLGNGWTADVIAHILSFSPWAGQQKQNEVFNQLTA